MRRRIINEDRHAFFVTFSCFRRRKLTYMHNNPVAAGLVPRAENWRFGSAGWYLLNRPVGVDMTPLG